MGLINYPSNANDAYFAPSLPEEVRRTNPAIHYGVVTQVNRDRRLIGTYRVELIGQAGLEVEAKLTGQINGQNGVGDFHSLEEGTPVIVALVGDVYDEGDAYILSTHNLEGNEQVILEEGKLQAPGETTEDGFEFNQRAGHPLTITQPDGYLKLYPDKTLASPWDSPEAQSTNQSKRQAQPLPGALEFISTNGDMLHYTPGMQTLYADGGVYIISGGINETCTAKLLRFSAKHFIRARSFTGTPVSEQDSILNPTPSGFFSLTSSLDSQLESQAIPKSYRSEQEQELGRLYQEQAAACNQLTAAQSALVESGLNLDENLLPPPQFLGEIGFLDE